MKDFTPTELSNCVKEGVLDLTQAGLFDTSPGIQRIITFLKENKQVTGLVLSNNALTDKTLERLLDPALGLNYLDLRRNQVNLESIELAHQLADHPTLKKINLSGQLLNVASLEVLAETQSFIELKLEGVTLFSKDSITNKRIRLNHFPPGLTGKIAQRLEENKKPNAASKSKDKPILGATTESKTEVQSAETSSSSPLTVHLTETPKGSVTMSIRFKPGKWNPHLFQGIINSSGKQHEIAYAQSPKTQEVLTKYQHTSPQDTHSKKITSS